MLLGLKIRSRIHCGRITSFTATLPSGKSAHKNLFQRRCFVQQQQTTRTRGLTRAIADMLSRSDWLNQQTWLFPGVAPTVPRGTTASSEPPPPIADSFCPMPRLERRSFAFDESDSEPSNARGTRRAGLSLLLLMRFRKAARRSSLSESKIIIQGLMLLWMATWACRVDVEQMFEENFSDRFLGPQNVGVHSWPE